MTATTAAELGGPTLPQVRRLVTEVPGPARASWPPGAAAVAGGVGSVMPVYAAAAGGGVLVDVDGNSLIDLGSGIAVTTVGNARPAGGRAVSEQVAEFTHTCFMVTPYEGYVAVAESSTGSPRAATRSAGAVQLGRRGGRERRQDRAPATGRAGGRRRSTTPTTAAPTSRWR